MESCRLKNRLIDGKDSSKSGQPKIKIVVRGLRLGGNGTSSSSSRHMTTSGQSSIVSKCLRDRVPPLAPSVKTIPERLEKHKTVSPLRRSDMFKKIDPSLSSSSSEQLAKESSIQKTMENREKEKKDERSSKHELKKAPAHMEAVGGIKRKKMTARTYRTALFEMKTVKETISDHSGSGNNAGCGCEPLWKRKNVSDEYSIREAKKLRDESSHKASDTIPLKLNGTSRGLGANVLEKKTMVDPDTVLDVMDKSSGGGNTKDSCTILVVEETFDDSKGLTINRSPLKNVDVGVSESPLSFARSRNDVINSKDHSGSGNNDGSGCEPLWKRKNVSDEYSIREVKKLRDGSSHKASDTIPQKLNGSSRGLDTNTLEKKTMVDPDTLVDVMDKSSGGGNRKDSCTILDVEETFDDSKGLPTNHSPHKNVDVGASESPLSFARSRNDVINSKEATPSPCMSENYISQVSCMFGSKEKRNSPETEVCSCRGTVDKDLDSCYPCKCPKDNCVSSKNCSLAQENCKEPSTVDDGLHSSSLRLQEETKPVKNSENREHVEGQILLQQKLALKNKDVIDQLDDEITKIQKKCERRMKKLVQNQQEEIKVFLRDWDDKRLRLESDHKLESALIRSIHHQSSARVAKLKELDSYFARKTEEQEFQKDALLKDLEAQQIAARNMERLKTAHWLAEAKACCSGEQKTALSLESQSGDDASCPQSSTHNIGTGDAVPIQRQHTPDKSVPVQENDVAPVSAPPDTEDATPIERQPTPDKSVSVQENDVAPVRAPPDTEDAVPIERHPTPDKSESVQENDVAPVSASHEEVSCIAPIKTPSNLVSISPQDEVFEQLNISKHLDHDEIVANLPASEERAPDEIQLIELDKEVPTELSEMVSNEIMDHVDPVEVCNDSDKGVRTGLPNTTVNQKDAINEVSNDTLLVAEQIPGPSVAAPASCVCLSEQPIRDSPAMENQHNPQNSIAVPQAGTLELPDLTFLQLGIDVGHLRGSSYLAPLPIPQVTSWNSPSLVLQNELELEKGYKDTMLRLKSDYKKELQELRNKYEVKRHDAEAEFRSKRNELRMNQIKFFKNKVLAEIFATYCSDLWSSSSQGEQQGIRSGSMNMASPSVQAILQLPLPHSTGLGPARSQDVGAPPVQAVQNVDHLSRAAPSGPLVGNPASNQHICMNNRSLALHGPHAHMSSMSQHLQPPLTFQNRAEPRGGLLNQSSPHNWLVNMNHRSQVPVVGGSLPSAENFSTFGSSFQHTQNHTSSAAANGELICLDE